MHPVFLYIPGERLSQAELCAARLDGDVIELGDVYTPADLVESATTRACGIEHHRQGHAQLAFVGPSAAWIHGAGDQPPNHHHLQRTTSRRTRLRSTVRATLHGSVLHEGDVIEIDGILVSAPERTLLDLARWSEREPSHMIWARRMRDAFPHSLESAQRRLDELQGWPWYRIARKTLAALASDA